MFADRHRLRQELRAIQAEGKQGKRVDGRLAQWRKNFERSMALRETRRAGVPRVQFDDDLPVSRKRDAIAAAIREHQVVIVCGETGSGKSTQIPKICLDMGRGIDGFIGHTQPRRIAARSIAVRIAEELGSPLGRTVGFKIRFAEAIQPTSHIKLMTDGILLAECQGDPLLEQYDTIIIDEAHERSLNVDFLLGYIKRLLPKRRDLKLIITSATIDAARFAEHFRSPHGPAPVIEVTGRSYPVEIRYRPLLPDEEGNELEFEDAVTSAVDELARAGPGDILLFMPTERDIHEMAKVLRGQQSPGGRSGKSAEIALCAGLPTPHLQRPKVSDGSQVHTLAPNASRDAGDLRSGGRRGQETRAERVGGKSTEILPLYARLSIAEQQRVFQAHTQRRIVIATNVAETSLTVPGIRYVIDPGTARISRYSARTKTQRLPIEAISQASANQRAGRCGRVAEGICIRLYSEEDFAGRDRFTSPEIQRTNLASVILQTKALRLGEIERFPFLDPPRSEAIRDGYKTLVEIGALGPKKGTGPFCAKPGTDRRLVAGLSGKRGLSPFSDPLDDDHALTEIGRRLARLPVDPRIGRMILAACDENCLAEVLVIAAALELQDPRERPLEKQEAADQAHAQFADPDSDFLSYLKLWDFYHHLKGSLSRNQLRKACRQNFLSHNRMREWTDIHLQLLELVAQAGMKPAARRDEYEPIHRAILTGLLSSVALRGEGPQYTAAGGRKAILWPGSGIFASKPKWIVAAEVVETTNRYLRCSATINPRWIEPLAGHVVHRSYSDVQWDRASASAMALEKVSLFGLILVSGRRVRYGPVNPAAARELLIRHGLVEGEIDLRADFLEHNRRLLEEMERLEAKLRRNDLVRPAWDRYEYYDGRIPEDVYDGPRLTKWLAAARKENPRVLFMSKADLVREEEAEVSQESFPDAIPVGDQPYPLEYHFEPGAAEDGITVSLPAEMLGQVDAQQLGWLVPGLLEQKIVALIRALPKEIRRHLVPAPETAKKALGLIRFGEGDFLLAVARALGRVSGQRILPGAFREDKIPDELRMNVRVLDPAGQTLASGRDLDAVRRQVGQETVATIAALDHSAWTRDGLKTWDLDELPEQVEIRRGNLTVRAFPMLVDREDSVALRLADTTERAARETRRALRRLFLLSAGRELKSQAHWLPNRDAMELHARLLSGFVFTQQVAELIADRALAPDASIPRTKAEFAALGAGLLTPPNSDRRSPGVSGDLRSPCVRGQETRAQREAGPSIPRTKTEFEGHMAAARGRIGLAIQDVAKLLGPLLEAYHQARLALEQYALGAGLPTPPSSDRRSPGVPGDLRSACVRGRETRAQQVAWLASARPRCDSFGAVFSRAFSVVSVSSCSVARPYTPWNGGACRNRPTGSDRCPEFPLMGNAFTHRLSGSVIP